VKAHPAIESERNPNRFATTRWSIILSCAGSGTVEGEARKALSDLCRIYWLPIFAFICRRGYSVPDAQDLTQDFFVMLLEGNLLSLADPGRGRFRSLLLKALKNFLIDKHDQAKTKKRGGGMQFVPWNDWMAEAPSQLSVPAREFENWPAERIFDLRWAATVAEEALRRLAEECESRGRRRMFAVLGKYLTADRMDVSYANLSASLGVPETSVKRLLHQLRGRFRTLLREEVSQTVNSPAEIEGEIRYLCAALATSADRVE